MRDGNGLAEGLLGLAGFRVSRGDGDFDELVARVPPVCAAGRNPTTRDWSTSGSAPFRAAGPATGERGWRRVDRDREAKT